KRIALVSLVLALNAGAKASELRVAPRQMARTSEFAERARRSLARPVDVVQFLEVEHGATNVGGPHHRHRAGELGNSLPWRGAGRTVSASWSVIFRASSQSRSRCYGRSTLRLGSAGVSSSLPTCCPKRRNSPLTKSSPSSGVARGGPTSRTTITWAWTN